MLLGPAGCSHATSTDGKAVAAAFKRIPLPDNPTIKKQLQAAMGWKAPLEKMPLIKNQVMHKAARNRELTLAEKAANRLISSVRSKVEGSVPKTV